MKIISAIGSFKGTIDSIKINNLVKEELEKQGHSVESIPVADGGDGLLDALCFSLGAKYEEIETVDALGKPIKAKIGINHDTAIIEMALASGLAILKENERNPLKTSTYGTGLLIKYVAEKGINNIILGIGGSATNDGGFGCMAALGFDFYDSENKKIIPSGENLKHISRIDDSNVSEKIKNLNITVACDVTNPLLGENGATYVYGKQKGATEEMLKELESGMANYAEKVAEFCKINYSEASGAGAAGGLGFGLISFLNAKMQKGAQLVLNHAGYETKLKNAGLVITGEGRIDNQTEFGKLPQIVAEKASKNNVKCIAIAGSCTASAESLENMGMEKVYELVNFASIDECMTNPERVIKSVLCMMTDF